MVAKQITNDAVPLASQRNIAGALIGEPTKNCVESVSTVARILISVTATLNTVLKYLCVQFLLRFVEFENNRLTCDKGSERDDGVK